MLLSLSVKLYSNVGEGDGGMAKWPILSKIYSSKNVKSMGVFPKCEGTCPLSPRIDVHAFVLTLLEVRLPEG